MDRIIFRNATPYLHYPLSEKLSILARDLNQLSIQSHNQAQDETAAEGGVQIIIELTKYLEYHNAELVDVDSPTTPTRFDIYSKQPVADDIRGQVVVILRAFCQNYATRRALLISFFDSSNNYSFSTSGYHLPESEVHPAIQIPESFDHDPQFLDKSFTELIPSTGSGIFWALRRAAIHTPRDLIKISTSTRAPSIRRIGDVRWKKLIDLFREHGYTLPSY